MTIIKININIWFEIDFINASNRAQAVVNGQTVEFDIYESRDFLAEFQRFTNCDAYIMVANPSHFSATDYANNLEQILK